MKTYTLKIGSRVWVGRFIAAGLGLAGLSCFGAAPAATPDAPAQGNAQQWQDHVFDQMKHIQQEMDDLFQNSTRDIDKDLDTALTAPRFDASATVKDQAGNYVASFYLPKRDLANVKVNVKDDVLTVNASAQETTKSKSTTGPASESEMLNQYEQIVTLPGPVDAAKMKVDKSGDTLVVTIPKK